MGGIGEHHRRISDVKRFGGRLYPVRVLAALAAVAALLVLAPAATADPYTSTDVQYLGALNHGGLCCPQQTDTPIWFETPVKAINTGHMVADAMKRTPTYDEFRVLRDYLYNSSQTPGFYSHPLNSFQSGEIVVVAVHYYAGAAVECALMKQMGGAMGEAPYWYGPVTYSGGLAVQPDCIKFSS